MSLGIALRNAGIYVADTVKTDYYINDVWVGDHELFNVGKTNSFRVAGADVMYQFNTLGLVDIKVVVDEDDDWTECNEDNNVFTKTVTVVPLTPDLVTYSHFIAPSELNPDTDEAVDLFVTYANHGDGDSDPFELKCIVGDNDQVQTLNVGALAAHDTTTVQLPLPFSTSDAGAYVVRVILDENDLITESDELNNEATRALIVGDSPNLFVQTINFSNAAPVLSELIDMTAIVENEGDLDCEADLEWYYVNDNGEEVLIGTDAITVLANATTNVERLWSVLDAQTKIITRIVNANPVEYNNEDNEYEAVLGPQAPLAISLAAENVVLCNGSSSGSINLTISGGEEPYNILWSNGSITEDLNNLTAGTYTVVVTDAAGAEQTEAAVLIELDDISVEIVNSSDSNCTGILNAQITGGTPPYTILWSTGASTESITVNSAANYVVAVSDQNGCSASANIDLVLDTPPLVTLDLFDDVCLGDESLVLTGGLPLGGTYSGDHVSAGVFDITAAGAGTYSISYTYSNGTCSNTSTQTIKVKEEAPVSLPIFAQYTTDDAAFNFSGGMPLGGSYQIDGNPAVSFDPGAMGVGTYTISYVYPDDNTYCEATAMQTLEVVYVSKVYYVSQSSGNDATGAVGADNAFATIGAALNVMNAGDDLHILDGNFDLVNLTVPAGFDLIFHEGVKLDVENNFTNNGFIVFNDQAELVQPVGGTITDNGGFAIVRKTQSNTGLFNFVGSPVDNINVQLCFGGSNVIGFDPASGWDYITSGNLDNGVGYLVNGSSDPEFDGERTFWGTPNTGAIGVDVLTTNTGNPGSDSWYVLANPYPSAMDMNTFLSDNAATLTQAIYVYGHTPVTGYSIYNPSVASTGYFAGGETAVASAQGFYVKAIADGTVAFDNAMRTTANFGILRATSSQDILRLMVQNGEGLSDEMVIAFKEEATDGL
jgi:hypothetical protein